MMKLPPIVGQLLRFGVVGTVGFGVDGGILWVLVSAGFNAFWARAISFPVAVLVTWALNRSWTFKTPKKAVVGRQISAYFLVQSGGALTNLLVYSGILGVMPITPLNALFAFAIGSIVGLVVNFLGARYLVFTTQAKTD